MKIVKLLCFLSLVLLARTSYGQEPACNPSSITANGMTGNSMVLDWGGGPLCGESYLVLMQQGFSSICQPNDGITYFGNSNYSAASFANCGDRVVYAGPGTSVMVTGLISSNTYTFRVFAYDNGPLDYRSDFTQNNASTTGSSEPTCNPATINIGTITSTTIDFSWPGCDGDRYLVLMTQGGFPCGPTDFTNYTSLQNLNYQSAGFGNCSDRVVYSGPSTAISVTNLNPGTSYGIQVFAYFDGGFNYNFSGVPQSMPATSNTPSLQASNIIFSNIQSNSVDVQVQNPGDGNATLLVASAIVPLNGVPLEGMSYACSQYNPVFGSYEMVGTNGFAISTLGGTCSCNGPNRFSPITITGLTPGITYYFYAFEANIDCSSGRSYNTTPASGNPASFTASLPEPTTQAQNINFTARTESTISLNWTNGNGSERLVVANPFSNPGIPIDGNYYTGNTNINLATNIGGGYVVYRGIGNAVTVTNLNSATQYYFRVFEMNGTGTGVNYNEDPASGNDNNTWIYTLATEPTAHPGFLTPIVLGPTTIDFTFPHPTAIGATGYLLLRRSDGANPTITGVTDGVDPFSLTLPGGTTLVSDIGFTTGYMDSPLSTATLYKYALIPYNQNGVNTYNYKTDLTITTASATTYANQPGGSPSNLTFNTITTTSMNGAFTAGVGPLTGYLVLRKTGGTPGEVPIDGTVYSGTFGASTVITTATNSFASTPLTDGTTYYYAIYSYNGSGAAINYHPTSLTNSQATLPLTPTANAATAVLQTSLQANWTLSTGATDYRLDVATNSGFTGFYVPGFQDLATGNVNSRAVAGLTAGTTYYYRVRAVNGGGTTPNSSTITQITSPPNPVSSAPSAITQTSFSANWSTATSATNYILDVTTDPGFTAHIPGSPISVGNFLTRSVTSLAGGTTYYYQVRAVNAGGTSGNSGPQNLTTIPADPVSTAATATGQTAFNANWNVSTGTTSYRLDVATDAGFASPVTGYSNLNVANVTTYLVNTNLTAGTTYYYRVRAVNGTGTSGNSGNQTLITVPSNPVLSAATAITQTSFSANWGAVTSATNYILDVTTDAGFTAHIPGSPISVGNFLTRSVTSLSQGVQYYYRVRAVNAGGTSGNSGGQNLFTIPPDPVSSAATAVAATSFSANWAASTGVTAYLLDVSTLIGFGSFVGTYNGLNIGNVTTYSVNTSLTAGTTYYYRVRATNGSGTSNNSGTQTLLTLPATPVLSAATAITQTSFSANWGAITSATNYILDVTTDAGFAVPIAGSPFSVGNFLTRSVTGLTAGTQYYYRVRAVNATGNSANSTAQNQFTIPPDPISSGASAMTQTSFSANWAASTSATNYILDVTTDAGFTAHVPGSPISVGNFITRSVTSLTAGTNYYYRVRAVNTGGTSGNSGSQTLILVPPNPASSAATSIAPTSFSANWAASTGASNYFLDVATDSGFTSFVTGYNNLNVGNVITFSVNSNISVGVLYYYRVRATNASGTSGNSATQSLTTTPPVPVPSAATSITQVSFFANWASSTGATGYFLDVSTSNVFGSFVGIYNNLNVGNVLTYAVNTNLTAGTTYYYRVRASNGGGSSASSSTISLATVSPVATAATAMAQTAFTANWTAATNATNYRLDVATDPGFTSLVSGYNDLLTGNVLTRNVNTGLSAGVTYYYRIRVVTAVGPSGNSNAITTLTSPPDPVSAAATTIAQTSFSANWTTSTGATSYVLDVSTSGAFGSFVGVYNALNVGNVTTYSVNSNLAAGTTYFYRVRAVNTSGTSGNSGNQSLITSPPNPVSSAASIITQTSFSANWAAATSATSFVVDVTTDPGFTNHVNGSPFSPGNVLTLSVTGLAGGTSYYYQVRAVNAGGTSGNSGAQTLITIPPNPVAIAASAPTASTITVNWNSATGAASYKLDVATDGGFSSFVLGLNDVTVSATSSALTGLSPSTTYFYRVRAVNASGTSSSSNTISQLTLTAAPVAAVASAVLPTGFTANWSAPTGATGYQLFVSSDAGFTSILPAFNSLSVAGTSSPVTDLTAGTTYYYLVRAVNATGSSVNSNVISQITVPPVPLATDPTLITTSSFTANWEAVTGADSYRLDVSSDNFATFVTGFNNLTITGLSAGVTGLSEGITYKYQVRAVNSGGISASSNSISLITVPPVPTAKPATSVTTSGFIANWTSVSGGTSYVLDVSVDNFTTFLTGYSGKSLATTSEDITGLQPNSAYQYRVRANSASGTSANSNVISVLTFPATPVAIAATFPGQTGFTANWNGITGVVNFALDVSADDFTTLLTGYTNLAVTGASKAVTGLTPGVVYKYRLRAVNATGASANSNAIAIVTVPATPVANAAAGVSQTGFTINWTAVGGLDNYLLDVSLNSSFASFVTGYSAKSINSATTSEVLSLLTNGTTYYYRVRAVNASGESGNSNTISQITIPAVPIPNTVQTATNNSFIASWNPVQGADHYELDVTLVQSNFAAFVTGYNARVVAGTDTEEVVSGLASGTNYYFRVRAVNDGGKSPNSSRKGASTSGSGVVAPFTVTLTNTNTQFSGSALTVQGQISNAVGTATGILVYKGITQTTTKEKAIEVSSGSYTVAIEETMLDDLGVEFFVKVKDEADVEKITQTEKIYRTFSSANVSPVVISGGNFEGTRASIKIISIPLVLSDGLIQTIFSSLGVHDKKGWRLAHYQDGQNIEYEAGINKIERGLGYWFNAKGTIQPIKSGQGEVGKEDQKNPFKLSLVPGWNQIGNPFPFAIEWSDVLTDNPGSGAGNLKVYDGPKQNYSDGDKLDPYTGGFVFADKAVTLNVNVALKNTVGRKEKPNEIYDLTEPDWVLPLTVKQNTTTYDISAIGMNPGASFSKDAYDEIRLPRLDEYLDITFDHPEYRFAHFTKDIAVTTNEHSWKFSIESSGADEEAMLEWNNSPFGNNSAQLFLLDVTAARFIDMRTVSSYSFFNPGKKEFRVYYRKDDKPITPDVLIFGAPYPNPSTEGIRTTLILPETNQSIHVEITAFNLLGQPVRTLLGGTLANGIHNVNWDGNDVSGSRLPSGIYLIRAKINGSSLSQIHKVILK